MGNPKRTWSKKDDTTLIDLRERGMGWKPISGIVNHSPKACLTRHNDLIERAVRKFEDDNPQQVEAETYLRKFGFPVYAENDQYVVGRERMGPYEMIAKAERIKRNNKILNN